MTALKLAIAGANPERGWARDTHIPALSAIPGIELYAVSARTQEIADAAAAAFGARKAYGDSLEMARDPDVDVVAVLVKVPEHRAIVLAALAAGKHVYCEWPLARDSEEAEELAAAARAAGTHVAIGLQGANSIAVRHAAKLVARGRHRPAAEPARRLVDRRLGHPRPAALRLSAGPPQRRDAGDYRRGPHAGGGRGSRRRFRRSLRAQFDPAGHGRDRRHRANWSSAPAPITC